ncbi:MAG: prephenate dehydrogenase/arogenate dehydrogenase family protein [Candidatus Omnitrophica bacterium]|nr:prephenate dehydrogenase/arogenate dehydrogenase family protein [Candidatus Omnitrophota bacterium]
MKGRAIKRKYMFKQVTIVGVGLIGASLARAIQKRRLAQRICGVFRTRTSAARALKSLVPIQPFFEASPALLAGSDAVILAAPVGSVIQSLGMIGPHLPRGCVVMDVGSTKREILAAAASLPRGIHFVGCHPMAGSEKSGPAASKADLFEEAVCFILKESQSGARQKAARFWRSLGAGVVLIGARDHDELTARTSHLPHVLSTALLRVVCNTRILDCRQGGGALRDMTRIAGSNPAMWRDIFCTNRDNVLQETQRLIRELQTFCNILKRRDLAGLEEFWSPLSPVQKRLSNEC